MYWQILDCDLYRCEKCGFVNAMTGGPQEACDTCGSGPWGASEGEQRDSTLTACGYLTMCASPACPKCGYDGAAPVLAQMADEQLLGRIHELIAAGERFEAIKLYAKTTGEGPAAAAKYVDEIASRVSGAHGGSVRAERREVTVFGKTLEEAQAKLRALVPAGSMLLKSKTVNKGERRITESGLTIDEAFAKAEKKLLSGEEIVGRRIISEPVERTATVETADPDRARDRAQQSLAKGEKVVQVAEQTAGRRRLFGLMSATNEYSVIIRVSKGVVEVVCSCPVEIRATISSSDPATAAPAKGQVVTSLTSGAQSDVKQLQAVLVMTPRPLNNAQQLLQQIVDEQKAMGHAAAPGLVATSRVGDVADQQYVYATIRTTFESFGGADVIDRTLVKTFEASDGNSGSYFLLFNRA